MSAVSDQGASIVAPIEQVVETWELESYQEKQWELPAGGYWLMGSHPYRAEQSTKVEFCFGADCLLNEFNEEKEAQPNVEASGGCSTSGENQFEQSYFDADLYGNGSPVQQSFQCGLASVAAC